MTLDSSKSLSIIKENKCFPNEVHVSKVDCKSTLEIKFVSECEPQSLDSAFGKLQPWGYIYIHNMAVKAFEEKVMEYNASHNDSQHTCFVHRSYRYKVKKTGNGAKKELCQTISGLVFLQGRTKELQLFLKENFPQYHLVNDCSTGRPASIADSVMKPFMAVIQAKPENVTFLREPFLKFAKNHVRLRVLSGLFKGQEGYIVRIDRDRQLVMEFAGYAVAIRGLHKEDFEEVKE